MASARVVVKGAIVFLSCIILAFILAWIGGEYIGDRVIGANVLIVNNTPMTASNPWWNIELTSSAPSFAMNVFYLIIYAIPIYGLWFFLQSVWGQQAADILDDSDSGEGYTRFRRG